MLHLVRYDVFLCCQEAYIFDWIIDFVSLKKAERIIKRDRKKLLPKLYAEAFRKEIFDLAKDCWLDKNK